MSSLKSICETVLKISRSQAYITFNSTYILKVRWHKINGVRHLGEMILLQILMIQYLFLNSYDNIVIFNYIHIITISSYKSHDCCHTMLHIF